MYKLSIAGGRGRTEGQLSETSMKLIKRVKVHCRKVYKIRRRDKKEIRFVRCKGIDKEYIIREIRYLNSPDPIGTKPS